MLCSCGYPTLRDGRRYGVLFFSFFLIVYESRVLFGEMLKFWLWVGLAFISLYGYSLVFRVRWDLIRLRISCLFSNGVHQSCNVTGYVRRNDACINDPKTPNTEYFQPLIYHLSQSSRATWMILCPGVGTKIVFPLFRVLHIHIRFWKDPRADFIC